MKIKEIREIIAAGGCVSRYKDGAPYVQAWTGATVGKIPLSTFERIQRDENVETWEEYNATTAARRGGKLHEEHENREICRRYAEELSDRADGVVRECGECGEVVSIPEDAPVYKCPCCGNVADRDDYDQKTLYDYLVDCYDIEYRIGGDREYRSAEICIAWGGPNVYVDTAENAVKLFWGGARATYHISGALSDEIDDICEEQYNHI